MKNFEEEYKNQINAELPDLWARIEKEIDALEADDIDKADKVTDISAANLKRKKISKIVKYSSIIAAAACLVVFISVFIGSRAIDAPPAMSATSFNATKSKKSLSVASEEAATASEAVMEAAAEEVCEDSAPIEEDYAESAAAEEVEVCEESDEVMEPSQSTWFADKNMERNVESVQNDKNLVTVRAFISDYTMDNDMLILTIKAEDESEYVLYVPEEYAEEAVNIAQTEDMYEMSLYFYQNEDEKPQFENNMIIDAMYMGLISTNP